MGTRFNKYKILKGLIGLFFLAALVSPTGCGTLTEEDESFSNSATQAGNPIGKPKPDDPTNNDPVTGNPGETLNARQRLIKFLTDNPEQSTDINIGGSIYSCDLDFYVESEEVDTECCDVSGDEDTCHEATSGFTINDDGVLTTDSDEVSVTAELEGDSLDMTVEILEYDGYSQLMLPTASEFDPDDDVLIEYDTDRSEEDPSDYFEKISLPTPL